MAELQGNPGYLSDLEIRIFLRDTDPEANKLIGDLEFAPEEMRLAMQLTVDKWNETPPPVGRYTVHTFPHRYHMLLQTSANLLTIAAHRYRRNHLQYSVPGGAINDQDRGPDYDNAAARLTQTFDSWMRSAKITENMAQGWGSV